jgi:hypothetical protein
MSPKWLLAAACPLAIGLLTTNAVAWTDCNCRHLVSVHHHFGRYYAQAPSYGGWRHARLRPAYERQPWYGPVYVPHNFMRDDACNLPSSGCTNDKRDTS